MVKFYTDIEEKFDDFFKLNYVAYDKFYIKTKADGFTGEIKLKSDEPELKAKFKDKFAVQDMKVEAEANLSSSGSHKFVGEWDVKQLAGDTDLKHTTKWNSNTNDHDTEVSLKYKGINMARLGLDFHYFKGGNWEVTTHLAKKIQKGLCTSTDFTWDGQKNEINSLNFGIFYRPAKWAKTWITHSIDGPINGNTKFGQTGLWALRQRIDAGHKTDVGFDYVYDIEKKSSSLALGMETVLASGVKFKSKFNSDGHMEASAKVEAADNWDVLIGVASNSANITGKQDCVFGIGIEGKLK